MSAWLNFNDSINNLKGQISTFATNVLADDEDQQSNNSDYEELKKILVRKELEIKELKLLNESLKDINNEKQTNNSENVSWNWEESPSKTSKTSEEDNTLSDLKKKLSEVEKERNELISQLELLDLENQQNVAQIVAIKDKLQDENLEIREKCQEYKDTNKKLQQRESKLKKELEELKKKTVIKEEKNVDNNITEKYQTLLEQNHKLKTDFEETKKEISVLKSSNTTLQKILEDTKSNDSEDSQNIKQTLAENKILYTELQKAKEVIANFERKSIEDAEDCQKIALILEAYEKQVSSLKEELAESQSSSLTISNEEEIKKLKTEQEGLKEEIKKNAIEKDDIHKKYVKIITENVKRYVDNEIFSNTDDLVEEENPQIKEFSKQVENILKEFKSKCESLEKKIFDITEDKTKILSEKNHEIEKLIQNSEILTKEILSKSEAIKDYESECTDLIKNNELLINELDTLKNVSGLQTISESNEDNLLMLESQLENANRRIEDLEKIIDGLEKQKTTNENDDLEVQLTNANKRIEDLQKLMNDLENEKTNLVLESQNQLDSAMDKLEITESEVNNKRNDFQDLVNNYDRIKTDNDSLQSDLENLQEENDELKAAMEKLTNDFESQEYQLSEVNINLESAKEELENQKNKIDELLKENNKIKILCSESDRNNEDIRTELNVIRERLLIEEDKRKSLENQVGKLTEKLQDAKMAETTLKLQYNNELMVTKNNLEDIISKNSMDLKQFEINFVELQMQNDTLREKCTDLERIKEERDQQLLNMESIIKELKEKADGYENLALESNEKGMEKLSLGSNEEKNNSMDVDFENKDTDLAEMKDLKLEEIEEIKLQLIKEKSRFEAEYNKLSLQYNELLLKTSTIEKQFEELNNSRNELINIVKTKHEESVTYHNEIQRLTQVLGEETKKCQILSAELEQLKNEIGDKAAVQKIKEENEKLTDQNNFLRQKCEIMAKNLLQEQAKVQSMLNEKPSASEKELALSKKLERLQSHLMELEEHYTQELLQAEQNNTSLQARVNEMEHREKSSSTMATSVSIRANQQVEALQNQLQLLTNQRDELAKKVSDGEDLNNKQAAALANLQFVLEQFQKDKENDVRKETDRIRRQILVEKQVQDDLKKEISNLKQQLEESRQGLQAASRLSDQLEISKRTTGALKEEVTQMQEKLRKSEETLKNITSQTNEKVDKSLVKNLVIGFVSTNNNLNKDQQQILKIISTVLDFNQQDHDKVNLNKAQQGSWLGSLLTPQAGQDMSQESLSQAFVKFLENESKPRSVPSLLNNSTDGPPKSTPSSSKNTPRQSPIVLSEIVLPTFADFGQSRNSSSILKDVLKDNTNNST